jgi:putative GTP pyrophosphokinase
LRQRLSSPKEFKNLQQRSDFYVGRARRFFSRYGQELDSIRKLLEIRLDQLALAYTLEHNLPRESVFVCSRIKSLESFLKKLEKKGWPEFYYPSEVATDLIGARIICWFQDDCYGVLEFLKSSAHIGLRPQAAEDYIEAPKPSGYRSIHLLADVSYDRVKTKGQKRVLVSDTMACEIQIRTKLQDAWGEFTHEVHYKVSSRFHSDYEILVAEIANRLASEDRSALAIRNILQRAREEKRHEGLRRE